MDNAITFFGLNSPFSEDFLFRTGANTIIIIGERRTLNCYFWSKQFAGIY